MRKSLGLTVCISALALAGCSVAKERVTLLSPAQDGKDIGGVVIEYDDGREAYLGFDSQQAKLRGEKVPHLVRQYDEADPFYSDLASSLPANVVREYFYFALGKDELAPAELDRLQAWLNENIQNRPGLSVEIAAHTDVSGGEELNTGLAKRRAAEVRKQVEERIKEGQIAVKSEDIEELPGSLWWAQSIIDSGQNYVPEDYRVAVVTIR
ncbi:MAG: OmpA family protein [Erythrobacter sp.]|uniref:OmpA family protein n=1 Tax=Erythrobacter sp. TaxID=1042 RepID=UPI00326554C9